MDPFESPERANEQRRKDEEYNSKVVSKDDLNTTKKDTRDVLYGPFTPKNTITSNKESENNKSKNLEKLISDINKDFKDKEGFKEKFKYFDFSIIENKESGSEFKSEFLNKVGWNYLEGLDTETQLSEAITKTSLQILDECKNLNTKSETYKVAMSNIKSWNILEQLEWIETLYMLAYNNEWKLSKTITKAYKDKKTKILKEEFKKVETELKTLEDMSNKTDADINKQKKLTLEYNSIIKVAGDLLWEWDIFVVTKLDINPSNTEKINIA